MLCSNQLSYVATAQILRARILSILPGIVKAFSVVSRAGLLALYRRLVVSVIGAISAVGVVLQKGKSLLLCQFFQPYVHPLHRDNTQKSGPEIDEAAFRFPFVHMSWALFSLRGMAWTTASFIYSALGRLLRRNRRTDKCYRPLLLQYPLVDLSPVRLAAGSH